MQPRPRPRRPRKSLPVRGDGHTTGLFLGGFDRPSTYVSRIGHRNFLDHPRDSRSDSRESTGAEAGQRSRPRRRTARVAASGGFPANLRSHVRHANGNALNRPGDSSRRVRSPARNRDSPDAIAAGSGSRRTARPRDSRPADGRPRPLRKSRSSPRPAAEGS